MSTGRIWWLLLLASSWSGAACDRGGNQGDADVGQDGDVDQDGDVGQDGDVEQDGDTPPDDIPEGCNPLAASWDCLLPYPSDVFLSTEGGERHLVLPEDGVIHNDTGHALDITEITISTASR